MKNKHNLLFTIEGIALFFIYYYKFDNGRLALTLLVITIGILIGTDSFFRIKKSLANLTQRQNKVLLGLNIIRIFAFVAIISVKSTRIVFIILFAFITLYEDFYDKTNY